MDRDERNPESVYRERTPSDEGRSGPITRRRFVATSAAVSSLALAGCGSSNSNGNGGDGNGDSGNLETPWTTEELADHIDEGSKIAIYAGTGDAKQWEDVIAVINDEFGVDLQGDVFAGNGGEVSQRFLQEKQADSDKADIVSNASDIQDEIRLNGEETAKQYYEWEMDEKFWFNDVLPDEEQTPFMIGAFNGGAASSLPINEDIFAERGLDIPGSYNDLFEDQYEGLETLIPGFVVPNEVGWVAKHHAEETDMDSLEWIETLKDHLNFTGTGSYTEAARAVARGNSPMMFFNWPWVISPFAKDDQYGLRGVFVDPVKSEAMAGPLSINADAPRPWVARFFVSAYLEESVQRRIPGEVTDQAPNRLDLDYQDLHPFTERRINANTVKLGFYEGGEFSEVGQTLKDNGAFDI